MSIFTSLGFIPKVTLYGPIPLQVQEVRHSIGASFVSDFSSGVGVHLQSNPGDIKIFVRAKLVGENRHDMKAWLVLIRNLQVVSKNAARSVITCRDTPDAKARTIAFNNIISGLRFLMESFWFISESAIEPNMIITNIISEHKAQTKNDIDIILELKRKDPLASGIAKFPLFTLGIQAAFMGAKVIAMMKPSSGNNVGTIFGQNITAGWSYAESDSVPPTPVSPVDDPNDVPRFRGADVDGSLNWLTLPVNPPFPLKQLLTLGPTEKIKRYRLEWSLLSASGSDRNKLKLEVSDEDDQTLLATAIKLHSGNIAELQSIRLDQYSTRITNDLDRTITQSITRGATSVEDTSLTRVISVIWVSDNEDGSNPYVENTDWVYDGNNIVWLTGGSSPTVTNTYFASIKYTYGSNSIVTIIKHRLNIFIQSVNIVRSVGSASGEDSTVKVFVAWGGEGT